MRLGIVAALALSGASALQLPLQLPLHLPTLPWGSDHADVGPRLLVDSDALQATISGQNLHKRAEQLYEAAKLSEEEYGHPTRVIGSEGESRTDDQRSRTQ